MNTVLTRWITDHRDEILQLRHWKKIEKYVKSQCDVIIEARELYDVMFPDKVIDCDNSVFVSWSVGYRSCRKGCECYTARLSAKMKSVTYTEEDKKRIAEKRKDTVKNRYGVNNVFQHEDVKQTSADTKLKKYGDTNYNNRDKAKLTCLDAYGVDNPSKDSSIQQQTAMTCESRYGTKSPLLNDTIKQKSKKTCLDRYGVETPSQNEEVKKKTKDTCLDRYGVDNPSKCEDIKKKISVKLKDTLHNKFVSLYEDRFDITFIDPFKPHDRSRVRCNVCGNEFVSMVRYGVLSRCDVCYPRNISADEKELVDYVRGCGVDIVENDRTIIAPKELDIYIPSRNLAIEYNGIYWHTEDKLSKDYHLQKTQMCHEKGIKLVHVYSDNWYNNKEIVESRIAMHLGVVSEVIYARDTETSVISTVDARGFLDLNHLDGYANSSVKLGLIHNGVIVSVMTFGKNRFMDDGWEMIRFASVCGVSVVGGASKLMKHFLRCYEPLRITTFSDNSWGYTDFYGKLGFTMVDRGKPSYSYVNLMKNSNERISRMRAQKHKLVSMGYDKDMTEAEIMILRGYSRIWNSGHTKWVWER